MIQQIKKGLLQVNKSNLNKLSKDQKNVAANVVQSINAKENVVIEVVDKDKVVDRQPVDPKATYLKITGYDEKGEPIFAPDEHPGETTPAGSGIV